MSRTMAPVATLSAGHSELLGLVSGTSHWNNHVLTTPGNDSNWLRILCPGNLWEARYLRHKRFSTFKCFELPTQSTTTSLPHLYIKKSLLHGLMKLLDQSEMFPSLIYFGLYSFNQQQSMYFFLICGSVSSLIDKWNKTCLWVSWFTYFPQSADVKKKLK